ncbi:MAG: hypothetical protein ACXQTS_05935 [Candidatus Methanospirareceae archaeon]
MIAKRAKIKMYEVFVASIICWLSILAIFIWVNRRLLAMEDKIVDLEEGIKEEEDED